MDIASLKPVSHPHPGFLAPCFYAPGIASSKLLVSTGIDPPSRATPYHCCISWFARWQGAPSRCSLGYKVGVDLRSDLLLFELPGRRNGRALAIGRDRLLSKILETLFAGTSESFCINIIIQTHRAPMENVRNRSELDILNQPHACVLH